MFYIELKAREFILVFIKPVTYAYNQVYMAGIIVSLQIFIKKMINDGKI